MYKYMIYVFWLQWDHACVIDDNILIIVEDENVILLILNPFMIITQSWSRQFEKLLLH